MDCHYIRDKIQDGSVTTKHVVSAHHLADVLTKPLGKEIFVPMVQVRSAGYPLSNSRGSVRKSNLPCIE